MDHKSLGASQCANEQETTQIGVYKNNWGMQSKTVQNLWGDMVFFIIC